MPSGMPTSWTLAQSQARRSAASFRSVLSLTLVFVSIPTLAGADVDEPAAGRQAEILHLLKHDCGSCHGMTLKGGLGPSLRPDVIAGHDDDLLIETILNGRPGTPMAPWRISLNETEARWLVVRLKEGIDGAE